MIIIKTNLLSQKLKLSRTPVQAKKIRAKTIRFSCRRQIRDNTHFTISCIEYSIWQEKNVVVGVDVEVFKNEKDLKEALEIALEIFDKPQPIYPEVIKKESGGIMIYKDSLNWDIYVGEVRLTLWQISKILNKFRQKK